MLYCKYYVLLYTGEYNQREELQVLTAPLADELFYDYRTSIGNTFNKIHE